MMTISRRTLMKYLWITTAGLSVPATKTIFLPPVGGWGTNRYTIEEYQQVMQILDSQMDEALQKFEQKAFGIIFAAGHR